MRGRWVVLGAAKAMVVLTFGDPAAARGPDLPAPPTMPDTAVTASTATSSTTAVLAAGLPALVLALASSLAITRCRRIVARG